MAFPTSENWQGAHAICVPSKGVFPLVFQNQAPVRLILEVHPTLSFIGEGAKIGLP